jgi:DNA repair protein RecO (recombination protein O)
MPPASAPRVYRTEALVLKAYDYGEADRILTLYTPTYGKLRAIAKGVRRTKSRMSGHVDLFTHSSLLVARGRQLDIVTQADTIESYAPLRLDLWRSSWAHYVAELVEAFSADNQANYPVFTLTASTFRRLAAHPNPELAVRAFEVALLALVGYRPQLYRCVSCETSIQPNGNRFSTRLGGVLCQNCHAVDPMAIPMGDDALKLLRNLQTNEEAVLGLERLPPEVRAEAGRILQEHIVYRLEGRPRSLAVIERLRTE